MSFKKSLKDVAMSSEQVDDLAGFDSQLAYEERLFGDGVHSDDILSCDLLSGCGTRTDALDDRLRDFSTSCGPSDGPEMQPTVSEKVQNALFAHSLLTNFEATSIKLPWEVGLYKDFFSDEPFSDALVPKMSIGEMLDLPISPEPQDVAEVVAEVANADFSQPVFSLLIACVEDEHFH